MSEPSPTTKKKILFFLEDYWQHYLVCLLFHLLLPLVPVAIEFFITGNFKTSTLTISAAMYAISIGTSSKSILEFGLCIVGSLIFAIIFGINAATEQIQSQLAEQAVKDGHAEHITQSMFAWNGTKTSAIAFIVVVFVFHAIARYNRHVTFRQPFWEFMKKEDA